MPRTAVNPGITTPTRDVPIRPASAVATLEASNLESVYNPSQAIFMLRRKSAMLPSEAMKEARIMRQTPIPVLFLDYLMSHNINPWGTPPIPEPPSQLISRSTDPRDLGSYNHQPLLARSAPQYNNRDCSASQPMRRGRFYRRRPPTSRSEQSAISRMMPFLPLNRGVFRSVGHSERQSK